jgi:hypothetical protein
VTTGPKNSSTTYRLLVLVPLTLLALGILFFALRPGSSDGPQEQTFDVEIGEGSMSPAEISVGEGDQVTLQMASRSPVEVHVHGYDLEAEIEPGEPATLSFEANTSGRFEIEDHETREELGTLVVEPR